MTGTKRTVYVSSTFVDLEKHRTAVRVALERAGYDVESMERYPASDKRPLDKCLADVAACDVYILILARREGFVPKIPGEAPCSITEREYKAAGEAGKPRLVFVLSPDYPWPAEWVDSPKWSSGRRLAALRKRVGKMHVVRPFSDPTTLALEVVSSLSNHALQASRPSNSSGYAWRPLPFGLYMAEKRELFEGREWLFAKIASWQVQPHSRALLVQADFGVGKSALVAQLVSRNPGGVIAWHFCHHDSSETLQPGEFVRSFAAQLAAALPDYRRMVEADTALQERLDGALADPGSALETAVLAPLATLPDQATPRLAVVDALDEALELDAEAESLRRVNIVTLLASKAGRFPRWLKLLVTSRPVPGIRGPLGAFGIETIDAERAENEEDLRCYIVARAARGPLDNCLREQGTKPADFVEMILRRSQGKFLYAALAMNDVELGSVSVSHLEAMARGMDSWYLNAFKMRFAGDGDYRLPQKVLGGLCAAREPISPADLAEVLELEVGQVKAVHHVLPDFLRHRATKLTFNHLSLVEWLTGESDQGFARAGFFAVDLYSSHQAWRAWATLQLRAGTAHGSSYLLRHLAAHLRNAEERRIVYGRLMTTSFEWIEARLRQDGVDALLVDVEHLVGSPDHDVMRRVLRHIAPTLRRHPDQLMAQILGRIGEGLGLARNLESLAADTQQRLAKRDQGATMSRWLPVSRSLRLTPSDLILQGGGHPLAITHAGNIVSGCSDGTVRVWDPQRGAELLVLRGHKRWVQALLVLPDDRIVSGGDDCTVRVWNMQQGRESAVLQGHTKSVQALAFSKDGRIVSGGLDGTVRVWDLSGGGEAQVLPGQADWSDVLEVLPDGRIVSGGIDGTLRVWDLERGGGALVLRGHTSTITALAVAPDGRLVSCSGDCSVRVWDLQNGGEPVVLTGHTETVCALAVLRDGRIVSGSVDHSIMVWDLPRGGEPTVLRGHWSSVTALAALPDGRLVSSGHDGTVRIWDMQSDSKPQVLQGHTGQVNAVAVLPDGRIASGSTDETIRIWHSAPGGDPMEDSESFGARVEELAVLTGDLVVSAGADATVRVWDSRRGGKPQELWGHRQAITALRTLPDGRLVSSSLDGTVLVWDVLKGSSRRLEGHTDWVMTLTVLPDGRIVSGARDYTVRVWDASGKKRPIVLSGHTSSVLALGALVDGRIVSGSADHTLRVWDLQGSAEPLEFTGHTRSVRSLAILPDGRIVSAGEEPTIWVWDPFLNGDPVELHGHSDWVRALAILPNGRVASCGDDGTVRVWDGRQGRQVAVLEGHNGRVNALAVLPNGQIVSAGEDRSVRIWDASLKLQTGSFIADAKVNSLAVVAEGFVVAGGDDGAMHFLREFGPRGQGSRPDGSFPFLDFNLTTA